MKFNEKAIFLKTKKGKIKMKIGKAMKRKIKQRKLFSMYIIILICFVILIIIIKLLLKKITKNKILTPSSEENEKAFYSSNESNNNKSKIVAITFGNSYFRRQIELNRKSALEIGQVNEHYSFSPHDLDNEFKKKNKKILSRGRGSGYWLWKPYIINKTIIEKLNDGDYLIYTDAAMIFWNSTQLLIDFLIANNASMWMNRLTLKERKFSKRDAFIIMGLDTPYFSETNQYMAGIQIYKKSNYTVKFIQEWLNYCQDERIISDDKNTLGQPNYKGFVENRHDQTALSLLIKKYGEANAGNPNMTPEEVQKRKSIIMPNILCMYRRRPFRDYEQLKEKCMKIMEHQNHIFS